MIRSMFAAVAALTLTVGAASAEVEIQEIVSPGGIEAWLVEEPSIPIVALELRFRGGTSLDAPDARGAVNLMTGLIEEGSGEMDALSFQTAREGLAASFGFDVYDDALIVSAEVLSENRDEALDLLRQALTDPRFDEDAIERVRGQVLAGIAADAENPNRIASDAFYAAAYPDHPYGWSGNGTVESVAGLTREDILSAHERVLTRGNVYVSAVGDITAEELGPLIDDLLGGLPEDGPEMPDEADYSLEGGVSVIEYPTPQSVALFGQPGIERDDPDFFAAYILNHILGGGSFESRLMDEVREKRGLTYGIGTYLAPRDHGELLVGSVASANDRIGQAIEVIRAEWERMAEEGVTQEELDAAKTYITGEYPLRFDGNSEIAKILVGMQMIDLPPSYVVDRNDYVEAVTLEDVNRVAAELLQPEALHFTVVGQPQGLGPDVPGDDAAAILPMEQFILLPDGAADAPAGVPGQ